MAKVVKRCGSYVLDFYDQSGIRRRETLPKGTLKAQANEELLLRVEQVL